MNKHRRLLNKVYLTGACIIVLFARPCVAAGNGDSSLSKQVPSVTTYYVGLASVATSVTTYESKLFNQYSYAKEDAAAFVASEGSIHGVHLERAWHSYRASEHSPKLVQTAFARQVLIWN